MKSTSGSVQSESDERTDKANHFEKLTMHDEHVQLYRLQQLLKDRIEFHMMLHQFHVDRHLRGWAQDTWLSALRDVLRDRWVIFGFGICCGLQLSYYWWVEAIRQVSTL